MGVLCWSFFWYSLLNVFSSVAIILTRKRELVALLLLSFDCLVTVNVLYVALPHGAVIVVFPDHIHLIFTSQNQNQTRNSHTEWKQHTYNQQH